MFDLQLGTKNKKENKSGLQLVGQKLFGTENGLVREAGVLKKRK